jgi:hypothetical protein
MSLLSPRLCPFALGALVLSACSGGAGATGSALPQGALSRSDLAAAVPTGRSWMLQEAKSEDLLYTSDASLMSIFVLALPTGKLVGTLALPDMPSVLCNDDRGDIFVTHFYAYGGRGAVTEYKHGEVRPIATRLLPDSENGACAFDRTTGDLAVMSTGGSPTNNSSFVSIFAPPFAKRIPPRRVTVPYYMYFQAYCSYDDRGNLFVTRGQYGSDPGPFLVELPRGHDKFVNIKFVREIVAGPIQWRGTYLAITADNGYIHHVRVSEKNGRVTGATILQGASRTIAESWIQGHEAVAPFEESEQMNAVGLWSYPGGSMIKTFDVFGAQSLFGVTISQAR